MIDEKLSWKDHINYLIVSLSKFYGIFNKIKYFVPKKHKLAIYNAYVLTKICYGIEIYGPLSETLSNRLQIVPNKLLKILFNMSLFHSTNQLHNELNILKVKDVYKSRVLQFVFQCLNHILLCMYNNYFQKRESLHDRNLRDMKNLHVPVGYSTIALSSTRLMVQKCGTNCHWKSEKLMMQSAFKTLWRAILWNHTPDSKSDMKFHETCCNIMWPGNNSINSEYKEYVRWLTPNNELTISDTNMHVPLWSMIAHTQGRSRITHIARRTPAKAGPSDEWLIRSRESVCSSAYV